MKKSNIRIFFSFIFLFISLYSFTSCEKKSDNDELVNVIKNNIEYYVFENTSNSIKGNYSNIPITDSLNQLLSKTIITKDGYFTVYEYLFKDYYMENKFIYFPDISYLYDGYSDNCNWVDDVLTSLEEERIGRELEKMENIISSSEIKEDQTESADKVQEIIESNADIPIIEIKDINNKLAYMEYDGEIFMPKKNNEGWILIHSSGDEVKRFFYDKLYRCYKEEIWNIKKGEKESLIKTVNNDFRVGSYIPLTKTVITEDSEIYQLFNDSGCKISEENYKIIDDRKIKISSLSLKYNEDNKVVESIVIEQNYKDEKYKDLDYIFNKKYVYKYKNDDMPPDFDYYENGILKISNSYKTKTDYISIIYFADDYSVTSVYKNNKIEKEIFTINGNEERIKSYEK